MSLEREKFMSMCSWFGRKLFHGVCLPCLVTFNTRQSRLNVLFLSDDNMKTVNWRVLPYGTKPSFTREGVVDLLLAPLMPVCVPATGQDW